MLTPIFNILIINVFWICVLDELFFADELGVILTKIMRSKLPLKLPKPFSCSTCMTWWTGLVYLLIINQLTFVNILFLILISAGSRVMLHLIQSIFGFFDQLINLFDHITGQDLI